LPLKVKVPNRRNSSLYPIQNIDLSLLNSEKCTASYYTKIIKNTNQENMSLDYKNVEVYY